ncbi:lysyl oxidase family protein [Nocardioides sp.]|uniref:lysyl oxidase family protein n=1 Tax=Nocardioides sp. TaxID=35761 RepID=UPI0026044CE0|nr:lysyl oxidase family protein [Nocardioides sp.]MDI6909730.1 lysyl oxidase family protein [Nocardioides sp.]
MIRSTSRALALLASLALAVPAALLSTSPATATSDPTGDPTGDPTVERTSDRAADTVAPITLWAPHAVTATAYRKRTWTDLGLRLIAQGAPFELWSHRPSYDEAIRTAWHTADGDVPLPAGSMSTFSGLDGFLTISITPQAGGEPMHLVRKACLNGWSERVRPDAPARSGYPAGCWYNPFSLGSVQGIQDGWATPILSQGRPFRLAPGTYTVTARIASSYAAVFGLSAADATRTVQLTVTAEDVGGEGTSSPRAASVARPAAHRPTGPQGRAPEAGPQPDLRSLPAWGIGLSKNTNHLRFSATVWNAGDSPLVVDGFRRDGEDEMDAYQYFFDAAGEQTGFQPVGHLHWDPKPSHQHWHFEDFARYSLLDADQQETARSKKEAFCLANTDAVDLTVPSADWRPENTDLSTSCGDYSSLSIREVLAAGWGDTYTQYRAGQSFDIRGLPNGTYYIAVVANPEQNLVEAATDNNVALRRIVLGGRLGHRTVRVPQVGIIEEEGYGGRG